MTNKSKNGGLTEEEKKLQAELRQEYLAQFRAGFKQTLDSIEFVDDKKLN